MRLFRRSSLSTAHSRVYEFESAYKAQRFDVQAPGRIQQSPTQEHWDPELTIPAVWVRKPRSSITGSQEVPNEEAKKFQKQKPRSSDIGLERNCRAARPNAHADNAG